MGSSNIFSFFFWKKSVKFSCIDLWSILVEYMCKTILQITSWHPGEKTWDEHQKQTKTHTSYNHINLKENHPSILSPQNTQHCLQKCAKFIVSFFSSKTWRLVIQLPLTKSAFSVGTKAGSVGTPTFAPDGANVASVPPTVPLSGQTGSLVPTWVFTWGFLVPHFKKKHLFETVEITQTHQRFSC